LVKLKNLFFVLIFLGAVACHATENFSGLPQELRDQNSFFLKEVFRIEIENKKDGKINISKDTGISWKEIGSVLQPVTKTNPAGFTASGWAEISKVCATAVNAIHIKTDQDLTTQKGVVFSILPKEFKKTGQDQFQSYLNPESSIITSFAAGSEIFGGGFSPWVGNLVYVEKNKKLELIPQGFVPSLDDRIVIVASRPDPYPSEIIFENRLGGKIYLKYLNGKTQIIGQVLKPVLGIGRFLGTQFAGVGRVRANHSGVIDISTAKQGLVGGFQIIPSKHGHSPELKKALTQTQWMIVAPTDSASPSTEGIAPLFSNFIMPSYLDKDLGSSPNWKNNLASRTLVQVKKLNGDWQPMPEMSLDPDAPLPDSAGTALSDFTAIRILLPLLELTENPS
jgi:hypothetical protein